MEKNNKDKKFLQNCFGQVLRKIRTDIGISQEKLALDVGLDRTYISLMERGLRTPTLFTIYILAERLEVTATQIISDVDKLYQSQ